MPLLCKHTSCENGKQIYFICGNIYILSSSQVNLYSDHDECSDNSHECSVNAYCTNTIGSYKCQCNTGFKGKGRKCHGMFTLNIDLMSL